MNAKLILTDLRSELDLFRQFHALLEAEKTALIANDNDTLVELSEQKNTLIIALNRSSGQRTDFLQSQNFAPNRMGMSEWIIAEGGNLASQLSNSWQELLDLAQKARLLNETSGVIIAAKIDLHSKTLDHLNRAASDLAIYSPDGHVENEHFKRTLGTA